MDRATYLLSAFTVSLSALLSACDTKPASTQPVATQPSADARPSDDAESILAAAASATSGPASSSGTTKLTTSQLRAIYTAPPGTWPKPNVDDGVAWVELAAMQLVNTEALPQQEQPLINLGHRLFFDGRMSGTGQMSCASCHASELGWTDGRTVAIGHNVKQLKRNTPSVMNAGMQKHFFWDGRAASLEDLIKEVLLNPDEHSNPTPESVEENLRAIKGYTAEFEKAFGDPAITFDRAALAIAAFTRTVTSGRSDFDRFLRGRPDALSDAALRGLHIYRTQANCMNCHNGPTFSDGQFHDLGLSYFGRKFEDLGRYRITDKPEDVGRFKTPSLRNVARNAPDMHLGLFDLEGVLNLYNAGMPTLRPTPEQASDPLFPKKSPHLRPLNLTAADIEDLKAFLESLTEPRQRVRPPDPFDQ